MDFMEKFNDSYQAVLGSNEKADAFFEMFYGHFTSKSEEIRSKFEGTDMAHQVRMLRISLNYMVNFFVTKKSSSYLERIAGLHGKMGLNISGDLYDIWLDSIIETLIALYPGFDRTIELAWRIVLAPGIEFMKFHYDP